MSRTIEEIRAALTHIFKKLEDVEVLLSRQEEDITVYMKQSSTNLDSNELLAAGLRSTRTSFELLRDEVDELYQLTVAIARVSCDKNTETES
ncbi:hypothetical protein Megvenef_01065 [Candidatus Megaera venefica]|uniref:Uncharacterized protein n=1 Tax=Candidatus Megaera venefica TaxID=2055910 RepID=A0ABU5ND60_9RICK|nr:hypothetical protein [Candidatus Megaera venefica]MEA0971093.1 hypothetical protein [Candidatus Megaera venefica]